MPTATALPSYDNFDEVLKRLGNIPPERVLLRPPPGKARVRDAARLIDAANKRLVEVIDGVLVEKAYHFRDAVIAAWIGSCLSGHGQAHDAGIVLGAGGPMEILPGQVRLSDVSFVSWERLPRRAIPRASIPRLVPDIAVEIINLGNTAQEMARRLADYRRAGVRLIWYVYPESQQAVAYTARKQSQVLRGDDLLDGKAVLPGFRLPVRRIFQCLSRRS